MQGIRDRNERNLRDQTFPSNNRPPRTHAPNVVVMDQPLEDSEILEEAMHELEDVPFPNVDASEMVDVPNIITKKEDSLEEEVSPQENVV